MPTPQQAVVPTRRERELGSRGVALATRLDHLAVRPPAENAALEEVLLPAQMRLDYLRAAPARQFVLRQGFKYTGGKEHEFLVLG